ncbi:MAG: hypothetical protein AAFP76_12190 [Bacteroidota bacterium]
MKIKLFTLAFFIMTLSSFAQESKRKFRAPVWITHSRNTDIVGLSLAAFPKDVFGDSTLTRTLGIRLEPSLLGVLSPLIPHSPVSTSPETFGQALSESPTEIVYGFNFSTGTFGETYIYGFSASFFMQYLNRMNGISIAGMCNFIESGNGIFISGFGNDLYKGNGIGIGGGNHAYIFNGIQIGLLNKIKTQGSGIQLSFDNLSEQFKGVQLGVTNRNDAKLIGLQIGIHNQSKSLRGIQLGLWNKNGKRSLPFINWQFKE